MKTIYFFILVTALSIVSCKNGEPKVEVAPTQKSKVVDTEAVDLNKTDSSVKVILEDQTVNAAYPLYLRVKAALVNSDYKKVKNESKRLLVSMVEPRNVNKLKIASTAMVAAKTLEEQRVAFEKLSAEMEALVKDQITEGTIFKQYCPMAFDGKGATWLSNSKEIRNPYYGDKMLKCGAIDATFN